MRWSAFGASLLVVVTVVVILPRRAGDHRSRTLAVAEVRRPPPAGSRLVSCGRATDTADAKPAQPRLFAPDSVWNRPLAPDAPLGDQRLADRFRAQIAREFAEGIGPWIQTTDSSTPLYTVGPDQRCVHVELDSTAPYSRTLRRAFRRVPLPDGARPAAGSDHHLTVWQPSTDSLWEFWRLRRDGGAWRAAWGGAMHRVSRNPGYFNDRAWPGARTSWGATATSLPAIAGTMTIRELERGRIDHALAVAIPNARADVYAFPAQRTDGTLSDTTSIPEGARFRLDPAVDLSTLPMPSLVRMMALAVQRYGLIVRDKTLHATGFCGEDPAQFAGEDPYRRLFAGQYPSALLKSFPWQYLRALPAQLRRSRH
jgi:hypothetical protein